jgi:hypothetical protein
MTEIMMRYAPFVIPPAALALAARASFALVVATLSGCNSAPPARDVASQQYAAGS